LCCVSQTAEAVLAADKNVSGEFENDNQAVVRVFSAKRYSERESEFDMFSHTPDRCWTSVGWKLEQATPEFVDLTLHGIRLKLERRIFASGTHRELVYFGALVGGQPLPYRLDPHLSIGLKRGEKSLAGIFGKMLGAIDARFLSWPWKSFVNRRPLNGPKQFIRVSTPVFGMTPGTQTGCWLVFSRSGWSRWTIGKNWGSGGFSDLPNRRVPNFVVDLCRNSLSKFH